MERIDYREGESFHFGGFPITLAHARGGRMIAFVGSGECETEADTRRVAKLLRVKLDKPPGKGEDAD